MKFIRADQTTAVQAIAKRIASELAGGKRVLWLVSGGSNVVLEVAAMTVIRSQDGAQLHNLSVLPMDERYGKAGHSDSNSQSLRAAGFSPGTANWVDVLANNLLFEQTVSVYNDAITAAFANAQIVIGQFGLGSDGHIAGILPGSTACTADTANVVGFKWHDYARLTLTPWALQKINAAYVPVFGENKNSALGRLQKNTEPVTSLPAQLLYQIPEVYVYNEVIESED